MKEHKLTMYIFPLRDLKVPRTTKEKALTAIKKMCKAYGWLPLPELKDIKEHE